MGYNFTAIEKKWQHYWDENHTFRTENDYTKPKFYALVEFPYPSGVGLHIGHPRPYTAMDIVARKRRMEGYNVLFPIGWDAFGLPTENYAIKNKIHPAIVTEKNIKHFKEQCKAIGFSFDWEREINTTDPSYFKWTQWIFLQMFKDGLAYKKEMSVNWCTSCKVVLANEEVVGGVCERCGGEVVHKNKSQWVLKITEYADKLLEGLGEVDYTERIKTTQQNWIGKSTGAEVEFNTTNGDDTLTVYTTRPDTLFGATYMVIAPEHPYIDKWRDVLTNYTALTDYREKAAHKSDFERTELVKEKTGVMLKGVSAINPVNGKEIPIFVSDYVLVTYGTGAIMAVPGHDNRDYDFATAFHLPIIEVVSGGDITKEAYTDCETGIMVNSGFLDGLTVPEAKIKITEWLKETKKGTPKTNYKLRDWIFSRQRYWGEPIPLVYCEKCGWVALPEESLPLTLPDVPSYMPTDNGESPLATLQSFIDTTCPHCGGYAKRETDTMPQWAGSSWYYLRYCDPHNTETLASKEALKYWLPVDWYNGGMEHVTLHLLYSRFWHKFLFDKGVVPTSEPYKRRTAHGMILGADGQKMSKSKGNVIDPMDIIYEYGADTLRLYEMFVGDFEKAAPWNMASIKGCKRFLDRIYTLKGMVVDGESYSKELLASFHKLIKKVTEDIESLKFNTAIAAMMAMLNEVSYCDSINMAEYKTLLTLLSPFAPHIAEELFLGMYGSYVHDEPWPTYDEALCKEEMVEIVVQINGKVRSKLTVSKDITKEDLIDVALKDETIAVYLSGKTIVKTVVVPLKLVSIVIK